MTTVSAVLLGGLWSGLLAGALGVLFTAPRRYLVAAFVCGWVGRCVRDLSVAWGVSHNWSSHHCLCRRRSGCGGDHPSARGIPGCADLRGDPAGRLGSDVQPDLRADKTLDGCGRRAQRVFAGGHGEFCERVRLTSWRLHLVSAQAWRSCGSSDENMRTRVSRQERVRQHTYRWSTPSRLASQDAPVLSPGAGRRLLLVHRKSHTV